jgi:hypothetical protein
MSFDFASLTLLLFWILSWSFFENFAKKDKVPWMVPSIAQVVFVPSVDAKCAPSTKHTASQTSWLHTCKESQDVPVNFS